MARRKNENKQRLIGGLKIMVDYTRYTKFCIK